MNLRTARTLVVLSVLLGLASACTVRGGSRGGGDDDDSAGDDDDATSDDDDATAGDDDDATSDDDDATSDDDDTPGDDDDATPGDDDDATPGDDDDTPDPDPEFVGETYCLDWFGTTIVEPSGFQSVLSTVGIDLVDWPILLTPTDASEASGSIDMLMGTALQGTCAQNTSVSTTDLSGGVWTDPDFSVGPTDGTLAAGILSAPLYGAQVDGVFTSDESQIVDGVLQGSVDVSGITGACLALSCGACPTGFGDCVDLYATDAVFDQTGGAALVPVP